MTASKQFTVILSDGYVKVIRPSGRVVCGAVDVGGKRLRDVTFIDASDHRCNRTRIAAMDAYRSAGYR